MCFALRNEIRMLLKYKYVKRSSIYQSNLVYYIHT